LVSWKGVDIYEARMADIIIENPIKQDKNPEGMT
jgi:hypothetical protein